MPIYDYVCSDCKDEFELFLRGKDEPRCPSCESVALERQLSVPGVRSETTRGLAMRAAKKRDKSLATDRMYDRMHYEESHDRHG
jgi:putative FmdB family regulatory protein